VAGQFIPNLRFIQAAAPWTYSISTTIASMGTSDGSGTINVTAGSGCA
jgi:hypothetical protein